VEVWRKLKRIGALPLGPPGYLLPNSAVNHEHFEWLASTIRSYRGDASVIQVQAIDDLPFEQLVKRFNESRSRDYQELIEDLSRIQKERTINSVQIASLRRRFEDLTAIDFFHCALQRRADELLTNITRAKDTKPQGLQLKRGLMKKGEFKNRIWITRPRPRIDRVASAWLIRKFIDPSAKFAFSSRAVAKGRAVSFDTFQGTGFSHVGEDCTFETLCKAFGIRNAKVNAIAEIVHDADLRDEKFGRAEGAAMDAILSGWSQEGLKDETLLERGMDLFDGLFRNMR
jgi:hypothetical protein